MITPGQAYLDAARNSLMAGPSLCPKTAAVAGGSPQALGFAVALARTGVAVTLIEDNVHDAQRVRDTLVRAEAMTGITIAVGPQDNPPVELVVEASGGPTAHRLALVTMLRALATTDTLTLSLGPDAGLATKAHRFGVIDTVAPPPHIGLIEILTTPSTPASMIARTAGLARALNVIPLPTPTFLAAPLLARFEDCAEDLVFRGSTPWELDAAVEAFGFDLGPCATQDLRGLDLAYARHRAEDALGTRHLPTPVLDRMVTEGRLGRKGSVGWYRYPGGGGRVIDPLIEDLAREEAHFAGVTPRAISDETLRQQLLSALTIEAMRLRDTGIPDAQIDLVATQATGFPSHLGGPLFHARNSKETPA